MPSTTACENQGQQISSGFGGGVVEGGQETASTSQNAMQVTENTEVMDNAEVGQNETAASDTAMETPENGEAAEPMDTSGLEFLLIWSGFSTF